MPDVVEDRGVDVALVAAEIRLPAARERVEVDSLCLLLALTAALPREHGAAEAGLVGRRTRLAQAPVPVHQEAPGDLGHPIVEKRIHVQLVPEDMSAVGLAVESPGRNPGIDVGCVPRAHLQQMAGVQAQQPLHLVVRLHPQVAHPPELLPARPMPRELGLEVPAAARRRAGLGQRVAGRRVPRGGGHDQLLHADCHPLPDLERQKLLDVVLRLVEAALNRHRVGAFEHAAPRRLADVQVRLPGLDLQRDHLGPERPRRDRIEVPALELLIAGDATVGHAPVERADDLDPPRPVLRGQRPLDPRVVDVRHADEPAAA